MKLKLIAVLITAYVLPVQAQAPALDPLREARYCTVTPVRDADGSISRRADVLRAFRKAHPCPVTGLVTGACPGWAMDHIIPLACGGCDAVWNLQWLPGGLKSAAGTLPKDRWERVIYCTPARPYKPAPAPQAASGAS